MIQRAEGGAIPSTATHMFIVYVELQDTGPSIEEVELKLADGVMWVEGVGYVEAHYLATAELIQEDLERISYDPNSDPKLMAAIYDDVAREVSG